MIPSALSLDRSISKFGGCSSDLMFTMLLSLCFLCVYLYIHQSPTSSPVFPRPLFFSQLHLFYPFIMTLWHYIFLLNDYLPQISDINLVCHFYFVLKPQRTGLLSEVTSGMLGEGGTYGMQKMKPVVLSLPPIFLILHYFKQCDLFQFQPG